MNLKTTCMKFSNLEHKEKRMKNSEWSLRDLRAIIKQTNICITEIPEREEREKEQRPSLKKS